jgi:hypothetical protein
VWAGSPGMSAEELAHKIKDRAELKRLSARVRRVLQEAVAPSRSSATSQVLASPQSTGCAGRTIGAAGPGG